MFYESFNIVSGKADYRLYTDPDFQDTVNYCIERILLKYEREESWLPDTLWIDSDNQEVHLWMSADREGTDRFMRYEEE